MAHTANEADAIRFVARAVSEATIANRRPRGRGRVDIGQLAAGALTLYLGDNCPNKLAGAQLENELDPFSLLVGRALQAGAMLTMHIDNQTRPES